MTKKNDHTNYRLKIQTALTVVACYSLLIANTTLHAVPIKREFRNELSQLNKYSKLLKKLHETSLQSMVIIRSKKTLQGDPLPSDFDDYYLDYPGDADSNFQEAPLDEGPGFIISNDGYILSSHKLVSQKRVLEITLNDTTYTPKLIGSDPRTDIALLKIDAQNLNHFKFGNSNHLQLGEWTLSLRYFQGQIPLILSTISTTKPSPYGDPYLYAQDVGKHSQHIGGLIDLNGHLVGLFPRSYHAQGPLSVALPMSVVSKVIRNLRTHGKMMRGWVGIQVKTLNPFRATQHQSIPNKGVYITSIIKNSPADKAGFIEGDLITQLGKQPIATANDFVNTIEQGTKGDQLDVRFYRNNRLKTTLLTIDHSPEGVLYDTLYKHSDLLGVDISETENGLSISYIEEGSPAELSGLKNGDIILEIDATSLKTKANYAKFMDNLDKSSTHVIKVKRNEFPLFVTFQLN